MTHQFEKEFRWEKNERTLWLYKVSKKISINDLSWFIQPWSQETKYEYHNETRISWTKSGICTNFDKFGTNIEFGPNKS